MTLDHYSAEHCVAVACDREGCGRVGQADEPSLSLSIAYLIEEGWKLDPAIEDGWLVACASLCPKHKGEAIHCDGCGRNFPTSDIATRRDGDWCPACMEERAAVYVEPVALDSEMSVSETVTATICADCNTRISVPVPLPCKIEFERDCPACGQTYIIEAEPDRDDGAKLTIRGKIEEVEG